MRTKIFFAGDVMTGRGVDQILPHPSSPRLHEDYVRDARDYVELAERRYGPIPRGVDPQYVWGQALVELARARPGARIINLETSVTTREERWPDKAVHYRMHPDNVSCLRAAGVDVCALANNHVLDYGRAGLRETIQTLHAAGIHTAGAGEREDDACAPASITLGRGHRLLVFSVGATSSGIPTGWAATASRSGVASVGTLGSSVLERLVALIRKEKRHGDIVVVSIHWGPNWGYEVSEDEVRFARGLVDQGADVVHGHSSHHPRPMEIYRGRLVMYGCGDFIDDYEGIGGYEAYRGDLVLMYLACLDLRPGHEGELCQLRLVPLMLRGLKLARPPAEDVQWLLAALQRINAPFAVQVDRAGRALRAAPTL